MRPSIQATRGNIAKMLQEIDANMGGTELGRALEAVYSIPVDREMSADILLITDGEVNEGRELKRKARMSGHRIFTVGVGNAVCEATVRGLADSTGGVCELVSPNENMAESIHRQFLRMTTPQAAIKTLTWPSSPKIQVPAKPVVYAGDTLFVAVFLNRQLRGQVVLELDWGLNVPARLIAEVQDAEQSVAPDPKAPATMARMAASMLLKETNDSDKALELSLRYQLVGKHTSYILVLTREDGEIATTLPVLRKVPHTLAAGWSGTGSAKACMPRPRDAGVSMCYSPTSKHSPSAMYSIHHDEWEHIVSNINNWLNKKNINEYIDIGLNEIEAMGVSKKIICELNTLIKEGYEEKIVILSFLMIIAEGFEANILSRQAKRAISWYANHYSPEPEIVEKVRHIYRDDNDDVLYF